MLHQNQNLQNQQQIKKLQEQKDKAKDPKLAEAIAKKIEALKTNKPISK